MAENDYVEVRSLAEVTSVATVEPAVLALRMLYYIFTEYIFAIVAVLALFGNIMSILITLQKENRKISTCNYMTALAMVDSNVTIAHGWALAWIFWAPAEDAPSELAMQGMWYLSYTSAILSGFYLAAMTIDRLIVVRFPMAAPRLCTTRRACSTITIIFIVFCSINVYMFYTFKTVVSNYTGGTSMVKISVPDQPEFEVLGNAYQLAIGTIAPFCVIVFCNLWIIVVLRNASKETGKMGVSKDNQKSRDKETAHLTRMLILVSIAYVVTSIPYRLYDVISVIPPIKKYYKMEEEYWSLRFYCQHFIIIQFWELNYGINFYLYCIGGGKKYRNDVKQRLAQIFSCCSCRQNKLLWLLLVLTCSGIMVFQIVDRIIFYCRFPVTVNVEINFNKTIRFPAVAICNQNAFRITEASKLGYLSLLENIYNMDKPEDKLHNLTKNNSTHIDFADLYLPTAHLKEDMIVRCFWDGYPCSYENFTMILTDHGVCYAFNGDQAHPLYISDTGTEHGLRLTVNVEQYEYMHGPHDSAGLKVLLYDTDEVPLVYELGQAVATGTHTFIGVKVLVMKYLPGPHGNCSGSNVLEHFPVYSETGCKLECMKEFYEKRCNCRMLYMPQKNGEPKVCNLGQYHSCVLKAKDEFKIKFNYIINEDGTDFGAGIISEEFNHPGKDICKCPLPCSTTIYEPNFSYSATSNFDVDSMLKIVDTDALLKRYVKARDTAHKVENRYYEVDFAFINEAATTADDIQKMLYEEFADLLDKNVIALKGILDNMEAVCVNKSAMYAYQEFIVRKNFLRGVQAMDERTFSQVSLNYFDFIFKYVHQVRTLLKTEDKAARSMIFSLLKIDIDARRHLTENALQNITDARDAYSSGTPIFEYQYGPKPLEEGRVIVPKVLLYTAVSREGQYSHYYLQRTFTDLRSLISIYHNLSSMLEGAYYENKFNDGLFLQQEANFTTYSRKFFGSRSNTLAEVFEYPVEEMQKRIENFGKLKDDFYKIYFDMKLNLESLVNKCRDIRDTVWPKYSSALKQARDYLNNQTLGKTPVAKVLIDTDVKNHITQLDLFFSEVRTRSQTLYDNWSKFQQATFRLWETILHDIDSKPYYDYTNTTWGSLSYTNVTNDTMRMYESVRDRYDMRTVMGNRDNSFFRAFEKMSDDFQEYISANKLNTAFYKENFLQMDVFYRKLSYELIEQQKAYDIFALLCDIGGSMGLFVGASALTVFEVIDVFAYHLCKKAAPSTKDAKKKKNQSR